MKRNYFVCGLLALCGSLNMQAAVDFTVNGITYSETDSAVVSVVANEENPYEGAISIPATVSYDGIDYTVSAIGEKAFYYCTGVTSVTLPETVTELEYGAFRNCSGMTAINLPSSAVRVWHLSASLLVWTASSPIPSMVARR